MSKPSAFSRLWELQWWEDYIKEDGSIGRRRQSARSRCGFRNDSSGGKETSRGTTTPVNQGSCLPQSTMEFRVFVERYFDPSSSQH